jgi:hypothetical protein
MTLLPPQAHHIIVEKPSKLLWPSRSSVAKDLLVNGQLILACLTPSVLGARPSTSGTLSHLHLSLETHGGTLGTIISKPSDFLTTRAFPNHHLLSSQPHGFQQEREAPCWVFCLLFVVLVTLHQYFGLLVCFFWYWLVRSRVDYLVDGTALRIHQMVVIKERYAISVLPTFHGQNTPT